MKRFITVTQGPETTAFFILSQFCMLCGGRIDFKQIECEMRVGFQFCFLSHNYYSNNNNNFLKKKLMNIF